MLGSAADAEDMVQETSLRWLQTEPERVRAPEAWLVAVVTRLSIDRLRRVERRLRNQREASCPSPLGSLASTGPERPSELRSELVSAFLALREQLEPAARTALVLREVFGCEYAEIARALDKSEAACRQIVRRARERVRQDVSGTGARGELAAEPAERFIRALSTRDREATLALLNDDAEADSSARRLPNYLPAEVRRCDLTLAPG